MTPREVIVAYLAVLNQMQHQIDLEYDKMAGALVDRLSDAGFVIVPRIAMPEMATTTAINIQPDEAFVVEITKP